MWHLRRYFESLHHQYKCQLISRWMVNICTEIHKKIQAKIIGTIYFKCSFQCKKKLVIYSITIKSYVIRKIIRVKELCNFIIHHPSRIYVPLLGTGVLSVRDGLSYCSHADPVGIGNFTRTFTRTFKYFVAIAGFLAMFWFTVKLVVHLKCNFPHEFRKAPRFEPGFNPL